MYIRLKYHRAEGWKRDSLEMQEAMRNTIVSDEILQKYALRNSTVLHSHPTRIYKNWTHHYDPAQIQVVLFDDLTKKTAQTYKRILTFLGLPDDELPPLPTVGNRKAGEVKAPMSPEHKKWLIAHYSDEIRACRQMWGEAIDPWLQKYDIRKG